MIVDQSKEFNGSQVQDTTVFNLLVIGLFNYFDRGALGDIPPNLRAARHHLALHPDMQKPKTLTGFLKLCTHPVKDWYPYCIPSSFDPKAHLLYDGRISEETQDYLYLLDREGVPIDYAGGISPIVLDNRLMAQTLMAYREAADREAAQRDYTRLRLFLSTHSWTTTEQLRAAGFEYALLEKIAGFYDDVAIRSGEKVYTCDYCGVLSLREGRLYGTKPDYCGHHPPDAAYVRVQDAPRNLRRLKVGIHHRVFLPGQAERRVFEFAQTCHAEMPDLLAAPVLYPDLDYCDVALPFSDDERWGVDVKDYKSPYSLLQNVAPINGYTHSFYVIPDRRFEANPDYEDDLQHVVMPEIRRRLKGQQKNLFVERESAFYQRIEAKVVEMRKAAKRASRQQKKGRA